MTELLSDSINDVRQYLKQRDARSNPAGHPVAGSR
jgi:hypothetical protein